MKGLPGCVRNSKVADRKQYQSYSSAVFRLWIFTMPPKGHFGDLCTFKGSTIEKQKAMKINLKKKSVGKYFCVPWS